ncbi:DUF5801 repeats-in-toxin domain-containing protein, partial [Mesorhizobium sp. B2-1-5]|uniref:DUF5801 repeats-in-toxin domain-containing protein n=2 Tax=unclassified Mesorhizobium TaxID=325217 RepID=UPI001AED441E
LASNTGVDSGLKTTDGHAISLFNDGHGHIIGVYDADNNGITAGDKVAFALHVDAATGQVAVAQYVSLQHPDTHSNDEGIALGAGSVSVTVTATDGDGDHVTQSADISQTVVFEDDGPKVLSGHAAPVTIDEDDIFSPWSQGTSPYDGSGDGSGTEFPLGAAIASGSLNGLVDFGADGPAAGGGFGFTGTAAADLTAIGLSSKGAELSWMVQGNTLVGFADSNHNGAYNPFGDRTVMTVTLNASSGAFVVRQFDQLDHVAPPAGTSDQNTALQTHLGSGSVAGIDLGSVFQAKDGDGDTVTLTGKATVTVVDDVPQVFIAATGVSVVHDETAGNQNDDTNSASVAHQFDSLGLGAASLGYAHGNLPVVLFGSLPGTDEPRAAVLSLAVAAPGTDSGLKTTDGHEISLFKEGNLIVGRVDNANGTANPGGAIAFAVSVDQTGHISTAQYLSLQHPLAGNGSGGSYNEPVNLSDKINAVVTVTDFDGDTVSQSLAIGAKIVFEDDGPKVLSGHAAPVTIDEDDIASLLSQGTSPYDGSGDGSGTEFPLGAAIASGSLNGLVDFGADGPAAGGGFGFTGTAAADLTAIGLSSKGAELSWMVQGNTLVGFADSNHNGAYNPFGDRTVMTVTLNASSGAFVVRQFDQLDHVAPPAGTSDQNTALQTHLGSGSVAGIDLGSVFQAKDGDGDTVTLTGKATVTVVDDVPQVFITATGVSVVHDETAGNQNDDTNSASVAHQFDSLGLGAASLGYAHGNLPVVLFGSLPGTDEPRAAVLSLAVAAPGTDSGLKTTDGHEISLFEEGNLIVGRVDNANGTANPGGAIAFAVSVDQTGHISTAQYLSLQHPLAGNGSGGSYDEPVNLSGKINAVVTVTDFDGDTVSQSLAIGAKIVFDDDGPKVTAVAATGVTVALDETATT